MAPDTAKYIDLLALRERQIDELERTIRLSGDLCGELLAARDVEIATLRAALEWYEQNARLCRLIHSGGDAGRQALSDDGGDRARAALA